MYSIAASRSHLEWLPLFFIAYVVMRDRRTLQAALLVLVLVTCVNGVVGFAQFRLSPAELSSWGPGYATAIAGTGGQSKRVYFDEQQDAQTRPFALGGDIGYGGYLAMLAIPALLALHATRSLPRPWMIVPLALGVTLALVTSQARSAIVGAVVSLVAYLFLTVRLRRLSRSALAFLVMAALAFGVVFMFASNSSNNDRFIRYETLAPGKIFDTLYDYRYYSFGLFPEYFGDYPLGAGLGSAGPAVALAVGGEPPIVGSLDAENQFNYLVIELGIPGLMLFFTFSVWLVFLTVFRIRKVRPPDVALMVAAVAAPLFALLASWIGFQVTAKTATAPYLWFAAGVLAYWLFPSRWDRPVVEQARDEQADQVENWDPRAALPAAR
jgi:O-antigen ligase